MTEVYIMPEPPTQEQIEGHDWSIYEKIRKIAFSEYMKRKHQKALEELDE